MLIFRVSAFSLRRGVHLVWGFAVLSFIVVWVLLQAGLGWFVGGMFWVRGGCLRDLGIYWRLTHRDRWLELSDLLWGWVGEYLMRATLRFVVPVVRLVWKMKDLLVWEDFASEKEQADLSILSRWSVFLLKLGLFLHLLPNLWEDCSSFLSLCFSFLSAVYLLYRL